MIGRRRGARSRGCARVGRAARLARAAQLARAARGRDLRARVNDPGRASRLLDDGGSASVLVALWSVVLTMLVAGAIALSSALAAREAVSAAADLAALAGSAATLSDPADACTRAARIARENGARLTECRVGGTEVWVVAQVPAPPAVQWLVPGRVARLRARAHAELTAEDP
jgi:secretion/DNA translocation related TadE-like protein